MGVSKIHLYAKDASCTGSSCTPSGADELQSANAEVLRVVGQRGRGGLVDRAAGQFWHEGPLIEPLVASASHI